MADARIFRLGSVFFQKQPHGTHTNDKIVKKKIGIKNQ